MCKPAATFDIEHRPPSKLHLLLLQHACPISNHLIHNGPDFNNCRCNGGHSSSGLHWYALLAPVRTFGHLLTCLPNLGYAIFFDYKRRNDPNFRKQLKKESKRQARAAKEEAEQSTIRQRQAIKETVEMAKEEGFPEDVEE